MYLARNITVSFIVGFQLKICFEFTHRLSEYGNLKH